MGFAYGYELNHLDSNGNMLYIHEIGVLPQYHSQGIGRTLIENLRETTTHLSICRFFLST
ncbi:GNAT family N-acetyltransferase [Fusibacter sp. JL298sf-3]